MKLRSPSFPEKRRKTGTAKQFSLCITPNIQAGYMNSCLPPSVRLLPHHLPLRPLQKLLALFFPLRPGQGPRTSKTISLPPCWADFHQGFSLNLFSHPTPVTETTTAPSALLPLQLPLPVPQPYHHKEGELPCPTTVYRE